MTKLFRGIHIRPIPPNMYSRERTGILGWNTGYSAGGHNMRPGPGGEWVPVSYGNQGTNAQHQTTSSDIRTSPTNDPDSLGRDNSPTEGLRIDEDE